MHGLQSLRSLAQSCSRMTSADSAAWTGTLTTTPKVSSPPPCPSLTASAASPPVSVVEWNIDTAMSDFANEELRCEASRLDASGSTVDTVAGEERAFAIEPSGFAATKAAALVVPAWSEQSRGGVRQANAAEPRENVAQEAVAAVVAVEKPKFAVAAEAGDDIMEDEGLKGLEEEDEMEEEEAQQLARDMENGLYHGEPVGPGGVRFSDEDESMVQDLWECERSEEGELVVRGFNIDITRHDVRTLKEGEWLNDNVIAFYAALVNQRVRGVLVCRQQTLACPQVCLGRREARFPPPVPGARGPPAAPRGCGCRCHWGRR